MQPYFLPPYHHYIFPLDVTILYYHCCCQITSEQGSDNCWQQKIEKEKRKVKKNLLEKKSMIMFFKHFYPFYPVKVAFFPTPHFSVFNSAPQPFDIYLDGKSFQNVLNILLHAANPI